MIYHDIALQNLQQLAMGLWNLHWNLHWSPRFGQATIKEIRPGSRCPGFGFGTRCTTCFKPQRRVANARERPKGRKAERPKGRKAERPKGRKAERPKGRKAERPKGRKAERPKGRKAERPKGRKAESQRRNQLNNVDIPPYSIQDMDIHGPSSVCSSLRYCGQKVAQRGKPNYLNVLPGNVEQV